MLFFIHVFSFFIFLIICYLIHCAHSSGRYFPTKTTYFVVKTETSILMLSSPPALGEASNVLHDVVQ